ncbi:Uncharacterized protein TCM_018061 [Theobroma cacao]|uniref:Uncharacterized protein n=1 Tax=Theobroma cacao TaxID=3641 RepID=A0A061EF78_THECC|nr:Uncharacterized protein TCM_018061 [Theobroma cacao]
MVGPTEEEVKADIPATVVTLKNEEEEEEQDIPKDVHKKRLWGVKTMDNGGVDFVDDDDLVQSLSSGWHAHEELLIRLQMELREYENLDASLVMFWVVGAILTFQNLIALNRPNESIYPRMCRWKCNQKLKEFYKVVQLLESSKKGIKKRVRKVKRVFGLVKGRCTIAHPNDDQSCPQLIFEGVEHLIVNQSSFSQHDDQTHTRSSPQLLSSSPQMHMWKGDEPSDKGQDIVPEDQE